MNRFHLSLVSAGVLGSLAMPAAPTLAANAEFTIEEITVTARRKEESLQAVPMAISAFSQADLEQRRIDSGEGLRNAIPSLALTSSGASGTNFTLRGQGATFYSGPGVVAYFAEVPTPAGGVWPGSYFDLENLQVLKGPQGTLFGRNSTGGAVLFEPRRPGADVGGYASITLGNYNRRKYEAAANLPIVADTLLARAAFDANRRDGYSKDAASGREYDDEDYWAGRLGISYRPIDELENYLLFTSMDYQTHGTGNVLIAVDPQSFAGGLLQPYLDAQQGRDLRRVELNSPQQRRTKLWGITNHTLWNLSDELTLKNIASYYDFKQALQEDLDASPLSLLESYAPGQWMIAQDRYTEELQLQGKSLDGALDWTAGLYYERTLPQRGAHENVQAFNVFFARMVGREETTQRSHAVYGQGTYDLGHLDTRLENLKFTLGLRHTWDKTKLDNDFAYPALGACFYPSPTPFPDCAAGGEVEHDATTWTLGLDYQLRPDLLLYAAARRGYKQGGVNPGSPLGQKNFDPEYVSDIELGMKAEFAAGDTQTRINLAAYRTDYTDVQKVLPLATPGTSATINAAKAIVQGFELDATLVLADAWEFALSYAYTDGDFEEFDNPYTGEDLSAVRYPFISRNKITARTRYRLPLDAAFGALSLSLSYSHQDAMNIIQALPPEPGSAIDSYALLNASVDWDDIAGTPISASLFATNLRDKDYLTSTYTAYSSMGYAFGYPGEPRVVGLRLRYDFGD